MAPWSTLLRSLLAPALALAASGLASCRAHQADPTPAPSTAPVATVAPADTELTACQARFTAVEALPAEPGAPAFDAARAEFLGRAKGEPMVFVREPRAVPD